MPQNPDLIATKCTSGEVLIFDRTKHSSEPERGGAVKPDIRLVGQVKEGCVEVFLYAGGLLKVVVALDLLGTLLKADMYSEGLKI